MTHASPHPIAVLGAGPVGLATAAHLVERGLPAIVLEAGARPAESMASWGHVRLFTPWSYLVDPAGTRLLEAEGWRAPYDDDYVPRAGELHAGYLAPLAALPSIAALLRTNHRVVSVSRQGHDRMKDGRRDDVPFIVVAETPAGQRRFTASAVIDASGTWTTPNPLGAGGVEADGEAAHRAHIRYGMPDILGAERPRYEGRHVLVVGSGHSAIGSVLSLVELAGSSPETQVAWGVRKMNPAPLWGGGSEDGFEARGALGTRVHAAVHAREVSLLTGLAIGAVREHPAGLEVVDVDGHGQVVVDELIVSTGARPDFTMLRELRLEFDVATEGAKALGPLIDPNHHSCGSVPPHGARELAHPEPGFFIVGMKSYGRAPTFLLRTGYEQARSVVAALAGDHEGARRVELVLPQTGVCSTSLAFGDGVETHIGCC